MSHLIGPVNDYDDQGRKLPQAPNRWQQIQDRLDALKPGYPSDPKARYILDAFQRNRDKKMDPEEALDEAMDAWDLLRIAQRESEDTGRWYRHPNKEWRG